MVMESETQHIIRKTGRKPVECKCSGCKSQCKQVPCLGTPADILKLIEAGYAQHIYPTDWHVGVLWGITDKVIPMYQLDNVQGHGCVLFKDGLCSIHHTGLKPTEGKLSHHTHKTETFNKKKSLSWNVAKTWLDPENVGIILRIEKLMNP